MDAEVGRKNKQDTDRLRLALEAVTDGIWDLDLATGKVYWGPSSYTMFGYEPDEFEITYDKWKSLVHPEDILNCEESVQIALQTDELFRIEFRFKCKNGSWQWTLGRGKCVAWDKNGKPTRMIGTNVDLTKRKQDEAALRKSESELKAIYENAPLLMLLVDRERRVVKMNDQALKFSGRTMEENVGLRGGEALRCVHAFDDPKGCGFGPECSDCGVRNAVLDTFGTGISIRCREVVIPFQHPKGKTDICVLVSTELLDGFENDVVLVCIEDITDRKRAETELLREKEFTEAALDGQQDTFFLFNPETGKALRWNKSLSDVTGYSDQEIADLPVPYSYYSKEDIERAIPFIQEVLDSGSGTIELDLVCKDGHTVPYEYRVSVVYGSDNLSKFFISIGRDITERKNVEKLILEREERIRLLFHQASDAIYIVRPDGSFIQVNKQACKDTGYTEEELLGMNVVDLDAAHHATQKGLDEFYDTLSVNKPVVLETLHRRKDGTTFPVEINISRINDHGRDCVFAISRDISERKKAEQTIRENEDRFRELFENMSSGVAIYQAVDNGDDFIFIDFNRAGEKIEHVNRKDIIGKCISEVFPGVIDLGLFDVLKRVWKTGKSEHLPLSFYQEENLAGWRDNFVYKLPSGEIVAIYEDKTDIKKAEQALQESENLLAASFSSIQDGMVILDKEQNIIRSNPVMEKWCPSEDSIVGKKCYTCFRSRAEPCEICPTKKAFESGEAEFEIIHGFVGSGIDWLEVYSYPIISPETGEISGVVEFLRDISERKKAEEALLESENKLREAHEMAQLGYWYWDVNTGEVEWSDQVYKIFRLSRSEFTPQIDSIQAMSPWPEEHQRDKELIQKAIEDHSQGEYVQKFLRPDGSLGYYYSTFQGIYDDNDNLIAMKGTVQDITERKRVEQELLQEQERLCLAQEAAGLGMFDWDIVKNQAVCSGRYFELFGMQPQDNMLSEQDWLARVHTDDRERAQAEVSNSLDNGAVYDTEYRVVWPDSSVKWVTCKAKVFRDENGKAYRMIGAIADITERKNIEEALEKRLLALTQPLDLSINIEFDELFNINEIQKLQDEFADAAGVASIITRPDGTPITNPSNFCRLCQDIIRKTEKGCANCFKSDEALGKVCLEGPTIQPCLSCGLWDAGAGIAVGGKHIANWLIGQVRDETQTEDNIRLYAREIGADEEKVVEAFFEVPAMTQEKFKNVAQALFTLAGQLSNSAYQNIQQARFISQAEKAEKILKNYNANLEAEVEFRTEELLEKNNLLKKEINDRIKAEKELKTAVSQLIQSEKLATVGQLAAGVAHEINTPLGAIGSSNTTIQRQFESLIDNIDNEFEILRDNAGLINSLIEQISKSSIELTSRQARQVKSIITEQLAQQQVNHPEMVASFLVSIGIVDDFNSYLPLFQKENSNQIISLVRKISNIFSGSKIIDTAVKQSSRVVYALRDYARVDHEDRMVKSDIKDTIETAIVLYGNKVKHGIDLKVELDSVPEIYCHPHELCQVWTNLISNSVHAMDNHGALTVKLKQIADTISVTISDNGCGIPDENKNKIFDPMFTTKPVGEGTGLGLDIVKRIVERHSGTLQLESQPGVGTTFIITLPVVV